MRLPVGAAAAVLFALVAPANAGGFGLPNGPCLLFCDPKPAPTPSPTAKSLAAKPVGAPRDLHPPLRIYSAAAAVEQKRAWRSPHASKPSGFRPQSAVASAPHPVPTPPRPSPVAAAAPAATPTPAPVAPTAAAQSAANASELNPANASVAQGFYATPPSVASDSRSVEQKSEPATRLLTQAFSERPQQAPTPLSSPAPATPKAEAAAAPPPVTVAMVEPAPPSAIVQVTANGLVFPWWPSSFPGRAAVWIVALALIAATAFGLAIASSRRLAA